MHHHKRDTSCSLLEANSIPLPPRSVQRFVLAVGASTKVSTAEVEEVRRTETQTAPRASLLLHSYQVCILQPRELESQVLFPLRRKHKEASVEGCAARSVTCFGLGLLQALVIVVESGGAWSLSALAAQRGGGGCVPRRRRRADRGRAAVGDSRAEGLQQPSAKPLTRANVKPNSARSSPLQLH